MAEKRPLILAVSKKKEEEEEEMVGLVYKLETEVLLKESAEKFYKMFKEHCFHIPTVSQGWIQDVTIHEGDWESHGSIRIWNCAVEGRTETFKEKVEFDDENNRTTLVGMEGHLFERYKSIQAIYHFTPDGSGCKARLALIYEKLREDSPHPEVYLNLMVGLTQDIETNLKP